MNMWVICADLTGLGRHRAADCRWKEAGTAMRWQLTSPGRHDRAAAPDHSTWGGTPMDGRCARKTQDHEQAPKRAALQCPDGWVRALRTYHRCSGSDRDVRAPTDWNGRTDYQRRPSTPARYH